MKTEFIPYEQALALKELGFDEPCMYYVDKQNNSFIYNFQTHPDEFIEWCSVTVISTPLYQQAFRWFREKYNLHAEITWSPSYEYEHGQWSDAIYEITIVNVSYTKEWEAESPDMQRANGRQLTYEKTELACLIKLIEIVKEK
jgi:hypothetical protein